MAESINLNKCTEIQAATKRCFNPDGTLVADAKEIKLALQEVFTLANEIYANIIEQ